MKEIRILSIDGGGIRGVIPAKVLISLEERLKLRGVDRPLNELFDVIAGTSTGGIIAAGLTKPGKPLSPAELLGLYRDKGAKIFEETLMEKIKRGGGLTDEKYSQIPLETILKEYFGEARLSEIKSGAELLITSYELERRDPFFFRSWRARGIDLPQGEDKMAYDFYLRDVCRATSAAPTFFEPVKVTNMRGDGPKDEFVLVDGGVFVNNPAMCAEAATRRLYPDQSKHFVVSLGTGQQQNKIPYEKAKDWGLVGWVKPLIDVIFDGVSDAADYQLATMLPQGDYYRLQISMGVKVRGVTVSEAMDDASSANIERLEWLAEELIHRQSEQMDAIAHRLANTSQTA